jgi:predicted KAP-like P-loop ATPase
MIWGMILLILYTVRKFKTDHQYQEIIRASEKDCGMIDEQSLNAA